MVWLYGAYTVMVTMILCSYLWDVLSARDHKKKMEYEWTKRDRELGITYGA